MTLAATGPGLLFPMPSFSGGGLGLLGAGTVKTLDATAEKAALIGHVFWAGRPASKTVSAAGSGKISFRAGALTWADGSTNLDIGIQGVATATGPVVRPDETYTVKATIVPGVDTLNANAWNNITMDSGTATINQGQLISIVLDMTARAGSDSVTWYTISYSQVGRPSTNVYLAGAWATTIQSDLPVAYITADDGTLGVIYGQMTCTFATVGSENFQDSTNPDERGLLFQIPWACKIDSFAGNAGGNAAGSDWNFTLYSDPTGTPSSEASFTILGEQYTAGSGKLTTEVLASEVSLSANTNYVLAARATGASVIFIQTIILPDTNLRAFIPGGTTVAKVTRDGGSGAFTAESPAVTMYALGVGISQLHDGAGGSGGGLRLAGHGGLAA